MGGADAQDQLIRHCCWLNLGRRWHWNLDCVDDHDSSRHERGGTPVGGGRRWSISGAGAAQQAARPWRAIVLNY